ncbi:MAG: glycosyltransferase family 9 protein, partial [Bacteroidota bacterium]
MSIKRIILSRVDSLGDVILSLPVAGAIKKSDPSIKVLFVGRTYSESIIEASDFIDQFINFDELLNKSSSDQVLFFSRLKADAIIHLFPNKQLAKLARKSHIPIRIGTSHRLFHLLTCNKIVNLGRKKSDLHESQLNLKLLAPLKFKTDYELSEIPDLYGFNSFIKLNEQISNLLSPKHTNIILHPKSKGSAREWGLDNFSKLIDLLPLGKFKIFITGTAEDGKLMSDFIKKHDSKFTDLTGRLTLEELVSFISKADGLVAASTG